MKNNLEEARKEGLKVHFLTPISFWNFLKNLVNNQ